MDYLKDLKTIVNINSYTKNKSGVDEVSSYMSNWLKKLGFTKKVFKREHLGNHILYETPKKEGIKILLLGHNDTVYPPNYFEGFREDEFWVYGPGVCDMKGGNIVALEALRNLFKKNEEIHNIDFLLVSDEETGSEDSKEVTSSIAQNYDYCFVFEAAGENLELVTARKGVGRYIIKIEGQAAHAGTSYEKGVNANLEGAIKLQKLQELIDFKEGTIINVGEITGGIGINTVSPYCQLKMEFRFETEAEQKRVMHSVDIITTTAYVDGSISCTDGIIQRETMQENQNQLDLIKDFEEITGEKISTQKRGGISDANIVANCGTTTLDGFGPYGDGDHTLNERALKSSFEQRISMVTKILDFYQKK